MVYSNIILLGILLQLVSFTNAYGFTFHKPPRHVVPAGQGYAPVIGDCPANTTFLRKANDVSESEKEWLKKRHSYTDPALRDFLLYTAKLPEQEVNQVLKNSSSINIGIAPSGGSFRAMLVGAGQLAALDNRTIGAFEHGLGGILQSATYLAGLSGSGWLVGSLSMNDYPTIDDILDNRDIWNLHHPFYNLDGINVFSSMSEWHDIIQEVKGKYAAGFDVSLTDFYARALARQLFQNKDNFLVNHTYSSMAKEGKVSTGEMPLPIIQANGRPVELPIGYKNSTVFEMNPFEFGTWDPSGNAFIDMKYLGTELYNGLPVNESACVTNYDNGGFLIGITSSLFDMVMDDAEVYTRKVKPMTKILKHMFKSLENQMDHVAIVEPNPFKADTFGNSMKLATNNSLFLVDGGEDQQKIPLIPLVQPERNVDIVFAYDLGAELPGFWPGGSSLTNTYERQFLSIGQGFSVPYVPDDKTMQALNYTHRPAFFGCDASNLTTLNHIPPVIVYTANSEYSYKSDAPTYKFKFSEKAFRGHISNGFETATRGNLTDDSEFATCVGCAVIKRQQERMGISPSEKCQQCFSRYCWDGTLVH